MRVKCDKADTSTSSVRLGYSKCSINVTGHPVPPSGKDWCPQWLGVLSANNLQLSAPSGILSGQGHDPFWGSSHPVPGHCRGIKNWPLTLIQNNSAGATSAPGLNLRSATSVTVPYISFLSADSCFLPLSSTRVGSKGTP